jgi:hypothetical protein
MIINVIHGRLSDATLEKFLRYLEEMEADMPFLLGLDPAERMKLQSIGDNRFAYVMMCLEYCLAYHEIIGMPAADVTDLEEAGTLYLRLTDLLQQVDDFRTGLFHTQIQAGANFYRLSRFAHKTIRIAHAKGRPGMESALEQLDKKFENQGKRRRAKKARTSEQAPIVPSPGPSTPPSDGKA